MSKSAADLISQARKKGEQLLVLRLALLLLLGSCTAGFSVSVSWVQPQPCWQHWPCSSAGVQGLRRHVPPGLSELCPYSQ